MSENLSLFEAPPEFDREGLAARLRALASEQIYLGTSSWRYEGWMGQIYSNSRYLTRGRFSKKKFEQECLREYAETFPIVGGDFSFYQFPPDDFWRKLFDSAPEHLKFGLKVPEEITAKRFSSHPRYGPRAGLDNPTFLSAEMLDTCFLQPLRPYRERIAVLMLEFGTFSKATYPEPQLFYADLDRFLAMLPRDEFRFSVEIRNEEYLAPEYFKVLGKYGVAHVFNAWTRMPPIGIQMRTREAFTTSFVVARALLRVGRSYEKAVETFSPYHRIREENPKTRTALRDLISEARQRRIPGYLFVNNRLEGNAPMTIKAVVEE